MKSLVKGAAFMMVVAALGVGWLYRDLVVDAARTALDRSPPASPLGRPSPEASASGTRKLRALVFGSTTDSVVLNPSETASLLQEGIEPFLRGNMDSLEVELMDGGLGIQARIRTERLPTDLLGPLGALIEPWEEIAAAGPLRLVEAGHGEWQVERLSIRGFPFPPDMVGAMVSRIAEGTSGGAVPVPVPNGIRAIAISPSGLVLYRRRGEA